MTNDEYPSGLATQKRSDKTFAKRIADRITVGHLLAAGVLAGFGAGFGSHALVGMLGNQDQPAEHCNHAPVISDDHSTGVPCFGRVRGHVPQAPSTWRLSSPSPP